MISLSKDLEEDESALSQNLDEVNQAVTRGCFTEAVKGIFALLDKYPNDIRPYTAAFHVLSSAIVQPDTLKVLPRATKLDNYKKVLLQEGCAEEMLVFHHGVASLLTSKNHATARAITAEIRPAIIELLKEGPPSRALVIYLLVARSVIGSIPRQKSISRWHEEYFARFNTNDLKLPYSVMFSAKEFGANRADLLRMFPTKDAALDSSRNLSLVHFLLLEWLTGIVLFADSDNCTLLTVLRRRMMIEELSQSELRAGRSLILRHWQPGSLIPDQILEKFGLGKDAALLQGSLNRREDDCEQKHPELRRSQQLKYRALQAARGMAGRIFPSIVRNQRRVRVAICVSGQLRGFKSALQTWRKSLLAYSDFDVFVHSWSDIGNASPQPFRSVLPFEGSAFCSEWRRIGMLEGFDAMQNRYPSLFSELTRGAKIDAETLVGEYSSKTQQATVVVEDESDSRFANYTNQDKMHYKIHAAQELAVLSGKEYDLFVRIRPDLPIRFLAFDWRDFVKICQSGSVIFCDHTFGVHYGHPMIGDQLAVGSPEAMAIYAATWGDFRELKKLGLAEFPERLAGHVSLAQQCWLNRILVKRIPMKVGALLDPEPLSCQKIRAAILEDTKSRGDKIDLNLLKANAKDCKSKDA